MIDHMGSATEVFFKEIDHDLTPFLKALDRNKDVVRTPKDIIPDEAREIMEAIESRTRRMALQCLTDDIKLGDIANEIASEIPEVNFRGDDHIGFFSVPGVTTKIDKTDASRRLVSAYIDFAGASREALAKLGHFHIGAAVTDEDGRDLVLGAEYASASYPTSLVWSDSNGRIRQHSYLNGVRIATHGTRDNYDAYKLADPSTQRALPSRYFGGYWGAVDLRSKTYPDIRRLAA